MVIFKITPGPPLYFKDKEGRNKELQRFSPDPTENYVRPHNTFSSLPSQPYNRASCHCCI